MSRIGTISQHHNLRTLRVTEPRTHLVTRLKVMELVRGCTPKTLLKKTPVGPIHRIGFRLIQPSWLGGIFVNCKYPPNAPSNPAGTMAVHILSRSTRELVAIAQERVNIMVANAFMVARRLGLNHAKLDTNRLDLCNHFPTT